MERLPINQNIRRAATKKKPIFVFALLITLTLCWLAPEAQAGPAPIQTFFMPLPERQVQRSLEAVDTNNAIGNDMRTIISIAATGDNTIFYYDHWEDGYEADMANPVQASTAIWGDNDPLNGIPPGFATDLINAGDIITLDNTVSLPRNPALIRYDGRDKFGGTKAVAVTRASWAVSPGVVLAGAVEVYPLRDYGLQFEVPVGEDLASDQMFQYVSLIVMAATDGTDIQIDIDGDGSTDITQTLNQGESYQVDGGIDTGASVMASNPVQAHIFTGDIGARYESRFYTLYPVDNWSDSYYSPVGTAADGDETYVFVYNPNGSAITVNYETRIGSGSFVVAAGGSYRYLMPSQSGAHFFTDDGSTFFAIATVGADPGANLVHDWGFSLLPESYLTSMAVVGWGPGSDDLSENGSPVWVTAAAATTIHVDYDGDPTTGPLTDANGDQYDVALNLSMLESARVYDNSGDNDQTGMKLYTLDGILITAAWGQDPANSLGGAPYLDLGTTVLPFPIASVEKTSAIVVDENSNGLIDWGDTLEYTIIVNNDGVIVLGGVVAFDWLPTGTEYVLGSTILNGTPVADDNVPPAATEFPLDEGGLAMPVIPPSEFSTITFRVTVNDGTTSITNSVRINTDQEELNTEDSIDVNTPDVTACSLEFTDDGGVLQATYLVNSDIYVTVDDNDQNTDPGSIQSFTVVVVNSDSGDTETITLTESGNDTGIFRNIAALPFSATGGLSHEDGTLYAAAGNTVQVAFRDPVFGDTCSDTAGITVLTEIKPLYLSEPGQGMDRVDPVAAGDSSTATSEMLGFSSSGTTETVRDEFINIAFNGNDGTWSWASDWQEIGEIDGPGGGDFSVINSSYCASGNCLQIREDRAQTRRVIREANLSQALSATLTLSYRRRILTNPIGGTVTLEVSSDGGTNFTPLKTYQMDTADPGQTVDTFDITPYIAPDTQIRFSTDDVLYETALYVDNVQIEYTLPYSTTGMAVWSATAIPEYNPWDGSSFGTTQDALTQSIRWRVMAGAAAPMRDEKIVVGIENGGEISGEMWNGSSWSKTSLTGLAFVNETFWWSADVAYEQQSGDAVLVWSGGNTYPNQVRYQVWNGSSWTAPANIVVYSGSEPKQMQIAANPNSDEMVLVVNDSNENDYAFVWNGSSWGNQQGLASSTTDDRTDIFVAYEQQSGEAMVVYGKGTSSVYYRIWNGSIWSGENSVAAPSGVDGYARWTTLGSDPNSNRIVLGVVSSGSDPWLSVWNGSFWDASVLGSALNSAPTTTAPNIAVAFESISGQAMAVSGSSDNKIIYKTWNSGTGWSTATTHPFVVTSGSNSMMLYADPNSDQLMYVVQDGGQDVNYILWDGSSWGTPTELETASGETKNQPFVFLYDQHIVPTGSSTTFTQSPVMCKDFVIPIGGAVTVENYVNVTSGSMPVNPDISATIKHDGTTIETLTNPTVTDLGSNIYRLDWTDVISSDTIVLAGEQVELEITTTEPGLSFEILYDSITRQSKILLPTTTVIVIHVDTLAANDAPYPGGSPVTGTQNGETLYLRATVSDPFGTNDITDLKLTIIEPCGGGPIDVTLDDTDVVATGGCSKTYEYAWATGMCQGNYDIIAIASEGTEGITDSAAIRVTLSFTDTGTAGTTAFTDGVGNPVSNYDADATICVQVTDMDENSNPGVSETLTAVVTSPQGDSETMTLTETGPNAGIFRACIVSSTAPPAVPEDGSLHALPGDVLVANYTDPDDASDTSDDTALVNTLAAEMSVFKLLVDPVDGTAVVNDLIRFDIVLGNSGTTNLTTFTVTDTFDAGCMSFDAASIAPNDPAANPLTWDETELGTLPIGSSVTLSVWFTADAACAPTVNTVSAGGLDEFGTAVSAGPATAQVTITRPELSVTKTLISPNPGPAYVGDPVTFRITLNNIGTSVISTLPLADTFSDACYDYQAATVAPDGIGAGSLLWNNLGPLPTSASTSLDVTLTVTGECNPAQNTADVSFAVDENGDSVPPVQDSAGLQTIGAKIGDRVWNDRDGDGVQDVNEGGIANVIVFVDLNGDGSRDPGESYDTTDMNGTYDITDLAAGTYNVQVDAATLPAGVVLTGGSNPLSVTVAAGGDFNTADFGYQGNASIGDFIWNDTDGDGNQDGGESGIGSVTVFIDVDDDGVRDAGEPYVITDGSGNFDFVNLAAGDYVVDVDDTTLPAGFTLTTGFHTLSASLADGEDFNDADFGYRNQTGVTGHLFEDVNSDGLQNPGEPDLAGIDVVITDSSSTQRTVTTDANGDYQAILPAGSTTLDVDDTTLPAGAVLTTGNDPQVVNVISGALYASAPVGYHIPNPDLTQGHYRWRNDDGAEAGTLSSIDVSIAVDSDDAEEPATGGTVGLTSSDLELVNDGSDQEVGVRFQNIAIPQGATITNAYIQFQADEAQSEATSLTIYGEDIANALTFATTSGNITNRTKTSASVAWNNIPAWSIGQRGANQQTPDLTSIVQEIVNIGTWSSGNPMVFIITGSGHRTAEAGPGADSAALHIEYLDGSGATWAAAEDTKLTGLAKQTPKRLRFLVENSGDATSGPISYELQVAEQDTDACGSGSYTAVDSSTHWNIVDSTYVTDGSASSNVSGGLTDPGGSSWVAGELEDSLDHTDAITLAASNFTEIEFAIEATASATTGGDYCFKLVKASSGDLDTYSIYAQVSILGPNLTQGHYRWRNDDGGESGALDTGTGADGPVTISSSQNINTNLGATLTTVSANPTGTSITVASTTGFSANDEILLINLQGASGDTADVGKYEFLEIASVADGTTLNLKSNVQNSYAGSSFGNQSVIVQRVPQWTDVTINSGGTLTANAWDGTSGGVVAFRATGTVTVNTGGAIDADGLGYRGGSLDQPDVAQASFQGESRAGGRDTRSQSANDGGGGGGFADGDNDASTCAGGGGGGSYGTAGGTATQSCGSRNGIGGGTYGAVDLTTIFYGSGGGSGGHDIDTTDRSGGPGGAGGGMVFITADTVTVSGTGTISANGADGGPGEGVRWIGGAGGSGGSIMIQANSATLGSSLVSASGGNDGGTDGTYMTGYQSGDGGNGRIRIEVDLANLSGSTDPGYDRGDTPGSGPGATFAAGEDVKLTGLAKLTPMRLRFMVANEGTAGTGGVSYQLYVAPTTDPTGATCPTESYQAIDDAGQTHWEMVDSGYISDGESTFNIDPGLNDEATSFVSGELKDSGDTTGSITLNSDQFTEIEFSIQATAAAPDAGEYCFKLVKDGATDTDLDAYAIYGQVNLAGATAVDLLSFEAMGEGSEVKVSWQTANEINNMGFYVYRADTQDGPLTLLSEKLIPGADFSTLGQTYAYMDREVTRGRIYYYRLVDVDTSGTRTDHGPICVDWDADGLPDDWEIAHGLDPTVNDADLDADNDGLTNLEEYERGSDPNDPDSNGDGILDGDEHFQYGPTDPGGSLSLSRGVHVLATDQTGITLELRTEAFETNTIQVDGQQFEKLSVKEYVHGYTAEVGKPRLPLKGIMIDIPEGQSAQVSVLDTASTIGYGYQVYPVPQNFADDQSDAMQVTELFTIDADAYGQDAFYPQSVVGLGEVYNFRDQLKQQLVFYPLSFNPVSGQIRHYSRIRVRIDYEDADLARVSNPGPQPWVPPSGSKLLPNPLSMGPTAMAFIGPTFLNSPIISAIASLGMLAQAAWMPPDFDWTTQGPAYKILVAEAGLYRLTGSYLAASGVDLTGVDIAQVRLYNLGTEIALTVYDENGNSGFDGSDYIEFYATAVDSEYAKYTNNNVYWLTMAGGTGAPLRMGVVDGTPAAGPDSAVHYFTVHYEPEDGYWQEAPGEDSLDRWFMGTIALGDQIDSPNAGQPVTFNLPLVDVVDSATGTLKIMLYGGYDTDHQVRVSYEGEDLGTFAWSGYTNYEVVIEDVNFSEQIGDGNYTLSVTCLSGFDKIVFDWIAATYPREFMAYDDSLTFTHDAGYLFAIDDFSTDELMVLDITDTDDPVRVDGFDIFEPIASTFSLEFETPADGQTHTYLVLAEAQVNTSATAVVADSGSDLAETANGADYILITHKDIGWDGSGSAYPWLDDLAALRQAQGLRVKLVNVQDIYDEFSYGLVTPQAIKDFLTFAYENWAAPAPEYVLLVGDSSYDYKDNWGLGTTNYVPAYLTYTEYMGETVTDEWFVTVTGDDAAADMYIGRLPAKSAAEAQVMVDKIIAYETGPNTKTWEKNTLLVADDQEEAFESVFKTMNEDAAALLPTDMFQPYKGYLQDYLDAGFSPLDLNSDILDQINAGALIANFSGHGHLQGWADESIFDVGDIDGLTNAGKYPFIVSMNCLTGYFAYPEAWTASFAELLLRAEEKGTAAALMPTGMTTTEGQHVMNTALFETIFVEDIRKLGPAIARAKRELLANGDAYFEQISQTFLLFGDPAMQLRVPLPRRPSGLVPALWTKSGVALRWDAATDCNNDPVAGYNVYRSTSPTGNFTKINQAAIAEPEFTDDTASASAAASSQIYYYTVTAVDADGDESSPSAMAASPSLVTGTGIISSGGSGGGGGGCFVSTTMNSSAGIELSLLVGIGLVAILLLFHMNIYMKRAS